MSALKWFVGGAFVLAIATTFWIAFIQPIGTMDWAIERANSHQVQLDNILRIVERNRDICFVSSKEGKEDNCPIKENCYLWTAQGFNAKCSRAMTATDKRDYLQIVSLMREIPIYGLQVNRNYDTGKIGSIEFGIYEGSLVPWRHPVSGVWDFDDQTSYSGCKHAAAWGWFVCEDKMILVP